MSEMSSGATVMEQYARERRRTRILLIVFTVLWVLALVPASGFALMFPFAFDQGPSDAATRVAVGLIGMPFAFLISLALMWVLFLLKKHALALAAILLPIVYLVVFAIVA